MEQRQAVVEALQAAGRLAVPSTLPIADHADALILALQRHQVVIVAGETGSGKSTQLPKLCVAAGRGVAGLIGHTQPRRVAARSIAERVAEELGTEVGAAVGCTVRFQDRVGADTVIRVMTDGILLAELQRDRDLRRYDTLIIDEAHERSLNIDFLLGTLRQLLPRRPDLTVVITSATIDTERFAAHFAAPDGTPAPIITIGGRTYPVDIRYQPPDDDTDVVQAICDAVDEVLSEGSGDALVFLSGEREIHDTADALRRLDRPGLEVLPLYARLSSVEQHRIFAPHAGRRVVLATNVAETSLTVPGIRYVIDAGTARMSRYSRRLKVQRLPIEPVSQASANQRAGRCGRVGPGICIRLYSEDDFAARPAFTEPEILRTNLASVMLQMLAIGLGDMAAFPFVEAPDRASLSDGAAVLRELGAIEAPEPGRPHQLTRLGRRLARLPVDPRLGRMVLEAEQRDCLREVLVIAAALSIQDPRERPQDPVERQQADELHRRFDQPGSDLLGLIALWDYLRSEQRQRSSNQFRKLCRSEHLNYLRVREWQDLFSQLRRAAGDLGLHPGTAQAHPDHVHQAVLAGLLSQVGVCDGDRRDFRGARGSSFVIAPGSVLTKKPPRWVMAAELVETDRLRARRVATIRPEWIEQLGAHVITRSYGEPRWDEASARALVPESVHLFGLTLVSGRRIGLDRVDMALAHDMFIRHALVEGRWTTRHTFAARNDAFRGRVADLEHRVRRAGLLYEEDEMAFFEERLDPTVVSGRHFDRWWRGVVVTDPHRLDLTDDVLEPDDRGRPLRVADYPDTWRCGEFSLPLRYRFEPGHPLDGTFVEIPVTVLNQLPDSGWDGHVRGHHHELVTTLIRTAPKEIRRELSPLGDTVDAVVDRLPATIGGSFREVLAHTLGEVSGVRISPDAFDSDRLPPPLRLGFIVVDRQGQVLDAGRDLAALRHRLAPRARAALAGALSAVTGFEEQREIAAGQFPTVPPVLEGRVDGLMLRGYPALVDEGERVSLRIVTTPAVARRAHRMAVRRLLLDAAPTAGTTFKGLSRAVQLGLASGEVSAVRWCADATLAAVDSVRARHDTPRDAQGFGALSAEVRRDVTSVTRTALAGIADIVTAGARIRGRLERLTAASLTDSVADATAHLERLIRPGFVVVAGVVRLPEIARYVAALEYRLERLGADVDKDMRRLAEIHPLERRYRAVLQRLGDGPASPEVVALGWQLEDLRVVIFAQPLAGKSGVSTTRCSKALTALGA